VLQTPFALDDLQVASPCPVSWDAMPGDSRVRFCPQCSRNVYNLSGMSRPEAEALVLQREGRLCVRFYRREDGKVATQDCPVGLQAFQRRLRRTAGVIAAVFLALIGLLLTLTSASGDRGRRGQRLRDVEPFRTLLGWLAPDFPGPPDDAVMGGICPPALPPPPGGNGPANPGPGGERPEPE
jgi:hypothetical protein